MGVLVQKGEAHLIEQNVPRIDILRAGHHGSRTSTHTSTLNALCPSHVILSLGNNNRFGFPHAETIRRIRRHGAGLWRTDADGRITVTFHNGYEIGAVNQVPLLAQQQPSFTRCQPPRSNDLN